MFVPNKAFLSLVFAAVTIGPTFVDANNPYWVDIWGAHKVPCISNDIEGFDSLQEWGYDNAMQMRLDGGTGSIWDGTGNWNGTPILCSNNNELIRAGADAIMLVYSTTSETRGGFRDFLPYYTEKISQCGGNRPVLMVGVTCPWQYTTNPVTLEEAAAFAEEKNIVLFTDQVSANAFSSDETPEEELQEMLRGPLERVDQLISFSSSRGNTNGLPGGRNRNLRGNDDEEKKN